MSAIMFFYSTNMFLLGPNKGFIKKKIHLKEFMILTILLKTGEKLNVKDGVHYAHVRDKTNVLL